MQVLSKIVALAGVVSATYNGFNYGSTNTDGSAVTLEQFTALFTTAQGLPGTNGEFSAARLYTMIQAGTSNGVISAIPAAINTNTHLLLGLWASAGQADFNNELAALQAAITQYGAPFINLIAGISVGSEDLYRISPTGIAGLSGAGADPATLVNYIGQVRTLLTNAKVSAPITHVDTWTAWVNGTNNPVIEAVDFVSMDAYPYFQLTESNGIESGNATFYDALDATIGASQGKTVWITETGWPVSGPTENLAVPSIANAKTYWDQVKCSADGKYNLFWYTLQDSFPTTPAPSFGIVGSTLSTTPLFDLTCPNVASSSSSTSSSSTASSIPASTASSATFSATSASLISTDTSIAGSSTTAVVIPPPATSASATSAPATSAPASSAPVSSAPASSAPVSSAPVTSASATSAPASSAPASSAPATSAPASSAPASSAPAGSAPVSSAPASSAPASSVPAGSAPASSAPVSSAPAGSAPASSAPATTAAATTTVSTAAGTTSASSSATVAPYTPGNGACSTDILSGTFEFPHLIVPVDATQPTTAFGTSYDGEFTSTVSSIFNFDVPYADAGKTCTVVFLLPEKADLVSSDYTFSGTGGLHIQELASPATESTTYANAPAPLGVDVSIPSVVPGGKYQVVSHSCGAGERISFKVSATGSLGLTYFQDFAASPIGFYISVC